MIQACPLRASTEARDALVMDSFVQEAYHPSCQLHNACHEAIEPNALILQAFLEIVSESPGQRVAKNWQSGDIFSSLPRERTLKQICSDSCVSQDSQSSPKVKKPSIPSLSFDFAQDIRKKPSALSLSKDKLRSTNGLMDSSVQ